MPYPSAGYAIGQAHTVCTLLDSGEGRSQVADYVQHTTVWTDYGAASQFASVSVVKYCPQHEL